MIYWFFGYPGIGKDYLAEILADITKISYINGDSLLAKKEVKKLISGTFTKKDRLVKLKRISNYLNRIKGDITITDSLPDKKSREFLLKKFKKKIIFILVKSSAKEHEEKIKNRKEHFFTEEMLSQYIKKWEPINDFPHIVFCNEDKTKTELKKELLKIYNKFSG